MGDVLAGKYRLLELLHVDAATATFRATDPRGRIFRIDVFGDGRTPPPGSGLDCGITARGFAFVVFDGRPAGQLPEESLAVPPSLTPNARLGSPVRSPLAQTAGAIHETAPLFDGLAEGHLFAGRYRVATCVGRGGMGAVYRALDEKLNRTVALKLVRYSSAHQDDETRRRAAALVVREARAAATLSHPNVVTLFDAGEDGGSHYLAMEYVEGSSLRVRMADAGVSQETRMRWLREIATALAAAHAAGIVHRDVKPENVMITSTGTAKVLDFGIAKEVSASGVTQDGMIVGSPLYMAPEHMYGAHVDGRCDQFAWGLVAHEVLLGRHPLARPVGAREGAPAVLPPPFDTVVARAVSQHPDDRFASMDALLEALGEKVPPRAPARSWSRRSRVAAAVVAAVAVVGVSFVVKGAARTPVAKKATAGYVALDIRALDAETVARCAPAARPALAAGLQLFRDAAQWAAVPKFDAAAEADPSCAAASFLSAEVATHTDPHRREQFRRARDQRSALTPRELDILDVVQPLVDDPPNYQEASNRSGALLARTPDDPDVRRLHIRSLMRLHRFDEALAIADDPAARAAGPNPGADFYGAMVQVRRRDMTSAFERFGRCLQVSPDSADCLRWQGWMHAVQGDCASAEQTLRHLTAVMPEDTEAYFDLGNVILMSTRDPVAARAAFEKRGQYVPKDGFGGFPSPEVARLADAYRMAVIGGRLEDALPIAKQWNDAVATSNNGRFRGEPLIQLIDLELELGNTAEAGALARSALSEMRAWTPDDWIDESIEIGRRAYSTGQIDAARFRALREEWAAHRNLLPAEMWMQGYAALPGVQDGMAPPVGEGEYLLDWHLMTAEAFARAADDLTRLHRSKDAVRHAEAAASYCLALSPMENVHAWLSLARAYDGAGDNAAACHAYADVEKALSGTHSSVSARTAHVRRRELSCKPGD